MSQLFKFQNIQLKRSTRQNTTIDTKGTLEEQFQSIQQDSKQQALDEIREEVQPSASDQIQDISSSADTTASALDELKHTPSPPSTDLSSIEIIDPTDIYDSTHAVPRVPEQRLLLPAVHLQDLLTDDEDDFDTIIYTGTSKSSNTSKQACSTKSQSTKVKSRIEADSETDDEDDEKLI